MLNQDQTLTSHLHRGRRGESAKYIVRVRVDPSVTSIPANAFYGRRKLAEVELCEGLLEIGEASFKWCDHSITYIIIPNHLGEFVIKPSITLSELPFVSTMVLKALVYKHSLAASSPTLESRSS
jgi:hypothetical protein